MGKRCIPVGSLHAILNTPGKCSNCGKVLIGRQQYYCSTACSLDFFTNHNWNAFRTVVIGERNKRCEECGYSQCDACRMNGQCRSKHCSAGLDLHHIIRIADGGEVCNRNNVKALCVPCHKKKHAAKGKE
jgi:hypothetical protein